MRILQIVTYASADGAFGGPLAVAVSQSTELARQGHQVDLAAGWDGQVAIAAPGVRVNLFPVTRSIIGGFSGLRSKALQNFVRRTAASFDVIHVHIGRDLITAPAAALALSRTRNLILQTHGMIMPDQRLKSRLFDLIWTKRLLKTARVVLHLTAKEQVGLRTVQKLTNLAPITNGVEIGPMSSGGERDRNDILFLARLHPRKRVLDFARAALRVSSQFPSARFNIVGPDEGDLERLKQFVTENHLEKIVAYEGTVAPGESLRRLGRCALYVLPSIGEVVPMSLLEAMSTGAPCVITSDNGLAGPVKEARAGSVTDPDDASLASAIAMLLKDDELRYKAGSAARHLVEQQFSSAAVVQSLLKYYDRGLSS